MIYEDEHADELDLTEEGIELFKIRLQDENERLLKLRMTGKLDVSAEELDLQSYTEYYSTGYGSIQSNADFFSDPRYYESVSVRRFVKLQKQEDTKDDLNKSTVSEDSYSDDIIVSVDTGNSD